MELYRWIIEHVDILGLIISFLNFIATVLITITIYLLQRKHEKEHEKIEEKARKMAVVEAAKVFLIDNDEEVEYLPLCVVALKLKLKRKHNRNIITKFLRCEEIVQKEIMLRQAVKDIEISDKSINDAIEHIQKDFEREGFGRNILYDGTKYLHRAFERYNDKKIDNINPYIFEPIGTVSSSLKALRVDFKWNLFSYMYEFINKEVKTDMKPPIDMVFENCNLGGCTEDEMTFWTMRIIIDGCRVLRDCNLFDETIIETQEDMYYYTLLTLYEAYCVEKTGDEE